MATFEATMYKTSSTTAYFSASFSGGDASYAKARYVKLVVGGVTYQITSNESSGGSNSFSKAVSGLSAGTTYSWTATLGYVDGSGNIVWSTYTDSGNFTTDTASLNVEKWSWSASTDRANFLKMCNGQLPVDYAYASVWNEIVDKIDEVLNAMGLYWQSNYASKANTKASAGKSLSAVMYNSAKHNVERMASTGTSPVSKGNKIFGKHFTALTDAINTAIG